MANDVFANGREISCKSGQGKSICAFPDVCFTPPDKVPPTPLGVPVPYPNTGMASDTTSGSKKVEISGKEVMLKNKSYFKKSTGDEAGCAAKKGFITSTNRGKIYFSTWSMDVTIEGESVVRHLDMTTHNHASPVGNESILWPFVDSMAASGSDPCRRDRQRERRACSQFKPYNKERDACEEAGLGEGTPRPKKHGDETSGDALSRLDQRRKNREADRCLSARRCSLQPYEKTERGGGGCCPGQTGNHVIPDNYVAHLSKTTKYEKKHGPCMCVTGTSWHSGNHQYAHTGQSILDGDTVANSPPLTIRKAAKNAATVTRAVFPESGCRKACIQAQIEAAFKKLDVPPETPIKYKPLADSPKYIWRTIGEVAAKLAQYKSR